MYAHAAGDVFVILPLLCYAKMFDLHMKNDFSVVQFEERDLESDTCRSLARKRTTETIPIQALFATFKTAFELLESQIVLNQKERRLLLSRVAQVEDRCINSKRY